MLIGDQIEPFYGGWAVVKTNSPMLVAHWWARDDVGPATAGCAVLMAPRTGMTIRWWVRTDQARPAYRDCRPEVHRRPDEMLGMGMAQACARCIDRRGYPTVEDRTRALAPRAALSVRRRMGVE